eukprot:TRINITY_DN39741_c0_g1_i1.p1 TRINITY_DN39741_c0_g1~~TRINITY_DN39741_c0_g1_i1.p1  ORF type:complete len:330 (-),score=72.12 TRINITY_DN39741_c0_g1_i1:291-1280(-)
MAPHRQMQMLVTRFERLSRRISLAGLLSGRKAEEAVRQGRVKVDGKVMKDNLKVFAEAEVTIDEDVWVPPPEARPKLWALRKPRKVLCQDAEKEGVKTLRALMREWKEREITLNGNAASRDIDVETLDDKAFVIVCGLPFVGDGLVLMTNDGLFAEALQRPESRILTEYDVKIQGDPPVDLLHKWRKTGARYNGVDYGQVFTSITRRSPSACRLRIRFVEAPDRPLEILLEKARMRVNRLTRYAFGPYRETAFAEKRITQIPIHEDLQWLIPKADMRQVLVPTRGGIVSEEGRMRTMELDETSIFRRPVSPQADSAENSAADTSTSRTT